MINTITGSLDASCLSLLRRMSRASAPVRGRLLSRARCRDRGGRPAAPRTDQAQRAAAAREDSGAPARRRTASQAQDPASVPIRRPQVRTKAGAKRIIGCVSHRIAIIRSVHGWCRTCFDDPSEVRMRSHGVTLMLLLLLPSAAGAQSPDFLFGHPRGAIAVR